jgi:hypothetical protein
MSDDRSEHILSASNVLKLTVDCMVASLIEHKAEEERRAAAVELYQQLAQWCTYKANDEWPDDDA